MVLGRVMMPGANEDTAPREKKSEKQEECGLGCPDGSA